MGFFENVANGFSQWFNGVALAVPNILAAAFKIILIFVGAKVLIEVVRRILKAIIIRKSKSKYLDIKKQETLFTLMGSVVKYVVYFIAIVTILNIIGLGITAGSLLATAGVGGIALSLGAQSFIKDIVNGAFIMFENQYSVGDYVNVGSVTGTVESVSVRSTEIRALSGELFFVPNGTIEVVTNHSRGTMLAVADVEITHEADVERAIESMRRAAMLLRSSNENIVDDPSVLGVVSLSDRGVGLRMMCKAKPLTHFQAQRDMLKLIKQCFEEDGIEIPYPRRIYIAKEA